MNQPVNLSRRRFMKNSSLAAGALVVGTVVPWGSLVAAQSEDLEPNALIAVGRDGRVIMQFTWNELGQGAMTSLAMVVADELAVPLAHVDVDVPIWEPKYGRNVSGGSSSMRRSWVPLRKAAAAARVMLVQAGAEEMGVRPKDCRAEEGRVVHKSGRAVSYGEVVEKAAALSVPEDPELLGAEHHHVIGTRVPRRDTPAKVRGEAVYASDLDEPGLIRAALTRSPNPGAVPTIVDESAALAISGVRKIVRLDHSVAVLADDAWSAFRGRDALVVDWTVGDSPPMDSAEIRSRMEARLDGTDIPFREDGDVDAGLNEAATVHRAQYWAPFIAHAAMEPSTCVVHVRDGVCHFEGPTQGPVIVANTLGEQDGIDEVKVRSTLVGSAFGRRLFADYGVEATLLSQREGVPIQVVWTREDEIRHDFFRPTSLHVLAGGLDADGRVTTLSHKVVAASITQQHFPRPDSGPGDEAVLSGVHDSPYAPANYRAAHMPTTTTVQLGWWRGVFDVQNAFANECFMDELAVAAGRDPVEMRLELLSSDTRLRRVVEEAARRSGWPRPSVEGRAVGFACHACFGSVGAQVAEVSVDSSGTLKVHRVVSVIECGPAVNPDAIRAQMEGGVAMGLGVALREEITFENGRVVEGNFDDYRPLRMDEMPVVETHILESEEEIGGIGEPVLPPTAPAVCNAIFAATGVRIRKLPIADQLVRS